MRPTASGFLTGPPRGGNVLWQYNYGADEPKPHFHPLALPGGANGVLFTGTKGKVEVNRGHIRTWPEDLMKVELGPNDIHLYNSPNHRQDWLNCIKTRKRPICDILVGTGSVTVCHLGNICYWLNRNIKWDPVKHEIIDDPEAGRWLDRPKRAPYRIA